MGSAELSQRDNTLDLEDTVGCTNSGCFQEARPQGALQQAAEATGVGTTVFTSLDIGTQVKSNQLWLRAKIKGTLDCKPFL